MIDQIATRDHLVTEAMLHNLPEPVRRYMEYTGVVGKPWIETARVRYAGQFRMGLNKPWMGISVEQHYTTYPPSFRWKARFSMAGVPFMFGDDAYQDGHAHMLGKLFGLFTIVDGQGPEIDQGTMVRYLQEMSWFPIAYLGDNITWNAVDDHCAEVTLDAFGQTASGRMFFDDAGRPLSFIARRCGDFGGRPRMETWSTPMFEYGPLAGLNLPLSGQGVWQLAGGDLAYINIRLRQVDYNLPTGPAV